MKRNFFTSMILIFLLAFFSKCKKDAIGVADINSVALNNCSTKSIEPYICFDSLLSDSRCPLEAVCVWQGTAIVEVTFHETNTAHSFIMSLRGFPSLGYPADTTINGYKIVFTALDPYPAINHPNPQTIKRATFSISH